MPQPRIIEASSAGVEPAAASRAAKRVRGEGAAGADAVPVQVGDVVMFEHLGIESMTVLPAPGPEHGGVNDMAERMVFTVSYRAAPGKEPENMCVSLKDMV